MINQIFERVATDAYKTPVVLYIGKLDRAAIWLRLLVSAAVLGGAGWGCVVGFPRSAGGRLLTWTRRWGPLILAGVIVGTTTSIRIVGPLAGALVVFILLGKLGRGGLAPSLALGLAALLTTYLTWPALWGDPVGQFLSHAGQTAGFTSFSVLYAGNRYEFHQSALALPAVVAVDPVDLASGRSDRAGRRPMPHAVRCASAPIGSGFSY